MSTQQNAPQGLSLVQQLNQTPATRIPDLPVVADRFKALYQTFHGREGARYYEAEKFHFAKKLAESEKLQNCTKLSLYGTFLDAAVSGLSFDPALRHCYLVPMGGKATLQISGYGELALRIAAGQIKHADNPVLVFEGDYFRHGTRGGVPYVDHDVDLSARPADAKAVACYLRIVRNDDTVDFKVLTLAELMQFKALSKDPNSLAWNKGINGMFQSKTIKHAFKSYPRLRILQQAKFTQLETQADEDDDLSAGDIYGLGDQAATGTGQAPAGFEDVPHTVVHTAPGAGATPPPPPPADDSFLGATAASGTGARFEDDNF